MRTTVIRTQLIGALFAAGLLLLVLLTLGVFFYFHSVSVMQRQLKEQLMTLAEVSSALFSGEEMDAIRGPDDMLSPVFIGTVERLRRIVQSQQGLKYAYLMRRTEDPMTLEFVSDSDALLSFEEHDSNGDGVLDPDEEPSFPGDLYDITEFPVMQGEAFLRPSADKDFTTDQWGTWISAYAPVVRADGSVAGILGIDMDAGEFIALTRGIFSPVAFLLLVVLGLLIAGYVLMTVHSRRMTVLLQLDRERNGLMQLFMHQLGSPLTIFKWSLENFREMNERDECTPDVIETHIRDMEEGIWFLENVFEGLVKADKVDAGTFKSKPERVAIADILEDVSHQSRPALSRMKQILTVSGETQTTINVDRRLIAGILRELIQNASIFSPEHGEIVIAVERRGARVALEVRDKGAGIPAEDLPHIFEKFYRGSNAARFKPAGNGLGLFVAKAVLEHIGGSIVLKSEEGKGTTVRVEVPTEQYGQ